MKKNNTIGGFDFSDALATVFGEIYLINWVSSNYADDQELWNWQLRTKSKCNLVSRFLTYQFGNLLNLLNEINAKLKIRNNLIRESRENCFHFERKTKIPSIKIDDIYQAYKKACEVCRINYFDNKFYKSSNGDEMVMEIDTLTRKKIPHELSLGIKQIINDIKLLMKHYKEK